LAHPKACGSPEPPPSQHMNKSDLLTQIIASLQESLEALQNTARASHAEATHESSKPENKYDTRGLEAAYLAGGQARQADRGREGSDLLEDPFHDADGRAGRCRAGCRGCSGAFGPQAGHVRCSRQDLRSRHHPGHQHFLAVGHPDLGFDVQAGSRGLAELFDLRVAAAQLEETFAALATSAVMATKGLVEYGPREPGGERGRV